MQKTKESQSKENLLIFHEQSLIKNIAIFIAVEIMKKELFLNHL